MTTRKAALVIALAVVVAAPAWSHGFQSPRGFNLRNVFDTARNLGALQAYAERNIKPELYPTFAGAAPAEWAAAWTDPPVPLDPAGLTPPYGVTARNYISSLGQAVFETAAGCDGTPGEVAYALWRTGVGLEWIHANATRDCLDCLSSAWIRLVSALEAIGSYFPPIADYAVIADDLGSSPPTRAEEIPGYNEVSVNLVQMILTAITDVLGDGTGFVACRGGTLVDVPDDPPASLDFPPLDAELKFYEGPYDGGVPLGSRTYASEFASATSRAIYYEIGFEHPPLLETVSFDLEVVWYRPDGSVLATQRRERTAEAGWTNATYWEGWGAREPGTWEAGSYRVEARIDGIPVASGDFRVTAAAPPPPPIQQCPTEQQGRPHLETHTPGQAVTVWVWYEQLGFSCGYLRDGRLTQWMMREEGNGYTLYRLRAQGPVPEYRLERGGRFPGGWAEGGVGYPVDAAGNRRPRSSTAPWSGRPPG